MEKPGGLQSTGSQSQTQLSDFTFTFFFLLDEICTEFLFLCFSSDGQG